MRLEKHTLYVQLLVNFVSGDLGFRLRSRKRSSGYVQTWLILPVVICLSQRLSHECLSISVSLRNCEWLIKTVIVSMSVVNYLDIHGNSRANTCVQTRLRGRVVFIRYRTNLGSAWCFGDS